jgi:hypothetical protein
MYYAYILKDLLDSGCFDNEAMSKIHMQSLLKLLSSADAFGSLNGIQRMKPYNESLLENQSYNKK